MYRIEFDVDTLYNTGSANITVKGGDFIEIRFRGTDLCHVINGRDFIDKLLFAISCTGDNPASIEFRKRALLPPTPPAQNAQSSASGVA